MTEEIASQKSEFEEELEAPTWHNTHCVARFVEGSQQGLVYELEDGTQALVPQEELPKEQWPNAGEMQVILVEEEQSQGWSASLLKAQKLQLWQRLEDMAQDHEEVEGLIVSANKGGLSVDIGLRAFLPQSHIDVHRVRDVSPYIGRTETFEVMRFDDPI